MAISQTELPYDLAISFLGIYPKEVKVETWKDVCETHVYSSIIHNSQKKVEAIQVSIEGWMAKQSEAYTHDGILLSFKRKEILTHATTLGEPWC